MKNKILNIFYKLSKGEIKYNLASKQVLSVFDENEIKNHENVIKKDLENYYSEKEVEALLKTQRGNCYVAILTKTNDKKLALIANNAPEPVWRK